MARAFQFRASRRSGAPNTFATIVPVGCALQPLAPAQLRLSQSADGTIAASWVRRCRAGFGWTDNTDASLAEDSERYHVDVWRDGALARAAETVIPSWQNGPGDQLADGISGPALIELRVRQTSALVGAGNAAVA